jgi:hypothetical protein
MCSQDARTYTSSVLLRSSDRMLLKETGKVGELRYLFRLLGASLMVDAGFGTIWYGTQ